MKQIFIIIVRKKKNQLGIKHYQEALQLMQKGSMLTPLDEVKLLMNSGILQGGSIQWYKNALQILRRELGGTGNPKMMKIMILLAETHEQKGDIKSAMHMYQELSIIMKGSGMKFRGPIGLKCLDKLGSLFFYQSEYENSLIFFKKSLSIKVNWEHFIVINKALNLCSMDSHFSPFAS